jgi:hypothetical protein
MGIDINAMLMVGLSASELDITKAPLYDEYVKELKYEIDASWWGLSSDFYYDNKDIELEGLIGEEIHYDNIDLSTLFIGFVIGDSGSWGAKRLDPLETLDSISIAEERFEKLFGKEPELILFPRYW